MLVILDLSLIVFIYVFEFLCKRLNFLIKQAQYAWIIKMLGFFMFYSLTRLDITSCHMLNVDSYYIYTNRKMNTMIGFLETNVTDQVLIKKGDD